MDVRSTLSEVENIWKEYSPDFPIELSFLDQTFEDLQKDERAQGKMFEILSAISLFIACLGILGLIAYIASQRKKEIGIRKVIGATALEVAWLLMRELLLLVFIAAIIAIPIVYFSVEKWSEQFAYRAPVQIWGYIVGAAFVMGIAAMVVGVQSAKAAFENPVKFLRSE